MTPALLMFALGMTLSAFFSGSETGFYRVTRVRLALDALSGSWIARGLLWLANNPALFVATALIGNNVANYLSSRAIVEMTQIMFGHGRPMVEVLVPVLLTPFVFVYGELLPKNLFYMAPNRLLRRGGVFFLFFTVVFAPISGILWLLARGLQSMVGESPVTTRLRLAKSELQTVFDEGHALGILQPVQRQLAQAVFDVAATPVVRYSVAVSRMSSVTKKSTRSDVMRMGRRHRVPVVLVTGETSREVLGYVRVVDLHLKNLEWHTLIRPLMKVSQTESQLGALIRMQTHNEILAEVVDTHGRTVGIVTAERLSQPLFDRA